MWVSGWVFSCFVCLFQPFISLWLGVESIMEYKTVLLLCLVFYFTTAGDMRNTYINATGIWWQNRWRPIIEAAFNVLLCLVLIKRFQIAGVLIAVLFSTVFINVWYGSKVLFSEYFKSQKFSGFILSHLLYFIVTIAVSIITFLCCNLIRNTTIGGFLLRLVICVLVPNALYVVVYHRKQEFKDALPMVKGVLKRVKH